MKFRIALVLICVLLDGACQVVQATDYFVAPGGSNQGDGSKHSPWKRIGEAVEHLMPGDTLFLRGGVYYESDIEIRLVGRPVAKIVIASYPGEQAQIVAGRDLAVDKKNRRWELVDANKGIYRSAQRYASEPAGWLVDTDTLLWKYESYREFAAPQDSGRYCGPGVTTSRGQLYIRLQLHSRDVPFVEEMRRPPMLQGLDPNRLSIRLIEGESAIAIDDSRHIELRNIRIHGGLTSGIQLEGQTQHVSIRDCELRFNVYGIVVGEGCSDIEVSDCRIRNGFPEWGRWGDVKIGDPPPLEAYNACAVTIMGASDVSVVRNRFESCFQAISVEESSFRIADNLFDRSHEGVLLTASSQGEIAHNILWHVLESFSLVGEDSSTRIGQVFIHHNVVDLSQNRPVERRGNFGLFERETTSGWDALGDHDCNESCEASRFYIYNNTFIGGSESGEEGWHCEGTPLRSKYPEHVEYNNIFVSLGKSDLRPQIRNAQGNVIWSAGSLLENVEPDDLVLDPGIESFRLELSDLQQLGMDEIRNRYRPTASACFSLGKSYDGLDWPGVAGVDYRGAVP